MIDLSHIEIREVESGLFVVHNPDTDKYVKMGKREVDFLRALDGVEDLEQFLAKDDFEQYSLTSQEAAFLAGKFTEWGYLHRSVTGQVKKSFLERIKTLDITTIKIFSINPDQFLDRIKPFIRIVLHPITLLCYLFLIGWAFFLIGTQSSWFTSLSFVDLNIKSIATVYVMMIVTTILHEFAHAFVCKYYGGKVNKLGFMIFYLQLAMYCDVSAIYLFSKKRAKVLTAFAGILCQWLLLSVAVLVYAFFYHQGKRIEVLLYYAVVSLGISLLNLIPLVKLDGYWMLAHSLGISNLREKSFDYLVSVLFRNKANANRTGSEKKVFLLYGLLSSLFTPCFWAYGLSELGQLFGHLFGLGGEIFIGIVSGLVILFYLRKIVQTIFKKPSQVKTEI